MGRIHPIVHFVSAALRRHGAHRPQSLQMLGNAGLADADVVLHTSHIEASHLLDINPITVFAGQNAAGSLGNLICPNNVVAACATVNLIGREGDVLRITFRAFFIILIEYMIISMLYTYMIFPNFGM